MVRCTSYCWNNSAFQSIGSLSFLCFEATESQNTMLNTTQEMQEIFFPLKVAASVAKKAIFCQLGLGLSQYITYLRPRHP